MPVWYDSMLKKHKLKIDVLHYKLLRVVIKDWQMIYPREMLDTLGRAPPMSFLNYLLGSIIINTINYGLPSRLYLNFEFEIISCSSDNNNICYTSL